MSYAENDGVRIYYEIEGSGPPLLLQHGFSQNLNDWRQLGYVKELASRYQVVLMDARGHGQSDKPHDPEDYSIDKHVADVLAVMNAAGIERAHFWGYSMGGWIGFGLVIKSPARLNKAVLGGVQPYGRPARQGGPDGSNAEEFVRDFCKRMGIDFDTLPADFQNYLLSSDTKAWVASLQLPRESLENALPGISTPCLLYAGDKDGLYAQAQKAASQMPNASFVGVSGAHVPAFLDSAAVLPHVLKFLG
ncbi:MAG: alpha/beta fold hydrolase [Alphaproteobacteria bacterium]|nr:alpha/beta fold hydrolase [Alphaproteobacteria bacterium]MCW5743221.1 alpha/beta fold hydrolase [Alphaproteobacteria bacterium]